MSSLISLSELKTYMDMPATDTVPNLSLSTVITEVSDFIENYIGMTVIMTTYTSSPKFSFYHGSQWRGESLQLKAKPVGSVLALYDSPELTYIDAETYLYKQDYTVDNINGIIYFMNGFRLCAGYNNVRIDYSAGYATVPEDLKQLTKHACMLVYKNSVTGIRSKEVPDYNSELETVLFKDGYYKRILDKYRTPAL